MKKRPIPRSLRRSSIPFRAETRSAPRRTSFIGRPVGSRNPVTGSRKCWTGFTPSAKTGRSVFWEGFLQRDMIEVLEADPRVTDYHAQPEPLCWTNGVDDFEERFPFRAVVDGVGDVLIAVKPAAVVVSAGLVDIYGHARLQARADGFADLELWTECEIRASPTLWNARVVAKAAFFGSEEELIALRFAMRECGGRATVRELRRAVAVPGFSPDGGRNALQNIPRLLAAGIFAFEDVRRPYGDDAVLVSVR